MKSLMYRSLISFALLIPTMLCTAQCTSFGVINYTVPEGYKLIKNDNVLTYYKEDKSTGAYCSFFVYNLMDAKGDARQCFNFCWENLLQKPFKITAAATLQPEARIKGWRFLLGNARYNDNGVATLALQITFLGENKMQNLIILSNSDAYKKEIEDFIAKADIAKDISQQAVGQGTKRQVTNSNASTTSATISPNIKYDVWMCHCYAATGNLAEKQFKVVVLSPDGRSLYYMPEMGLNAVTPQNSKEADSWGRVTDKGNKLVLVNDKYGNMELYKINSTSMSRYPNSTSSVYKKVKQVDGLRFEGAYSPELSYYNGRTDIISKHTDPNRRPVIFFKKDGTYINEGITFSNLTFGDDFVIGKGAYEIVNYSLVLTTQTGRKLQVAFTPVLDADPAGINSGLIINNNLFYRLDKTFVPRN